MTLPAMGAKPRYLEELRIGGGYGSSPDGGVDADKAGNLALDGDLTVDGDADIGGSLEVAGVDGTWSAFRTAKEGWPAYSNPCGGPTLMGFAGSWRLSWHTLDFDKDADEYGTFNFVLPGDYDGRELRIALYWTATSGTGGNVRWRVYLRCSGDDDGLDNSTIENFAMLDGFLALKDLHVVSGTRTPSNAAAGNVLVVTVQREATHADDTFDADARLIGVRLSYA